MNLRLRAPCTSLTKDLTWTRPASQEMLSQVTSRHLEAPNFFGKQNSIEMQTANAPGGGIPWSVAPRHQRANFSWPNVLDGSGPGSHWPGGSVGHPGCSRWCGGGRRAKPWRRVCGALQGAEETGRSPILCKDSVDPEKPLV